VPLLWFGFVVWGWFWGFGLRGLGLAPKKRVRDSSRQAQNRVARFAEVWQHFLCLQRLYLPATNTAKTAELPNLRQKNKTPQPLRVTTL